ncbi:ALP1-like protein [Tanacetum coccineum]
MNPYFAMNPNDNEEERQPNSFDVDDESDVYFLQQAYQYHETLVEDENRPVLTRNPIHRDREGAEDHLMDDYFDDHYPLPKHFKFFKVRPDATGRMSLSVIMKCTAAIRQLAYDTTPNTFDEYLQMSERTARDCLLHLNMCIIDLYMSKYLRKPTLEDVEKIYNKHVTRHGFPGMLGSIDCIHWEWKKCPISWQGQYGANNDINVLDNSSLFNDPLDDKALVAPFVVNGVGFLTIEPIPQLDVKNAFLYDHLTETVYMHQPSGFTDSAHSGLCCFCKSSNYWPKQAPRALEGRTHATLILYVDDIFLQLFYLLLHRIISLLQWECDLTDLGHFQTFFSLGPEGSPVTDPTLYRSLAGSLQYLTFTRPDFSYAVQQLCLYMMTPRDATLNSMKTVFSLSFQWNNDLGLQLFCPLSSLLFASLYADWAGFVGYASEYYFWICVFRVRYGDNLMTWSSKRQDTLSSSSDGVDYAGLRNA